MTISLKNINDEGTYTLVCIAGNTRLYHHSSGTFRVQGYDDIVSFNLDLPSSFADDLATAFMLYSKYLGERKQVNKNQTTLQGSE